jgi:DNA-binding transcriptional ArsR family regulator
MPKKNGRLSRRVSSVIKDDMLLIISLMKRSGVNRILALIAKKPGLSVKELSIALKIRKETTSVHIRELLAKGVIVKDNKAGTPGYAIRDEKNKHIIRAIDFALAEK